MSGEPYDAIVIGGGHNGLVNGAYLARGGLRTLILEQREMVGGAAITEELRTGFWFTTFSYALSLLRPQIVHELELPKHGFLPLEMSSRFAPTPDGVIADWPTTVGVLPSEAAFVIVVEVLSLLTTWLMAAEVEPLKFESAS